MKVKAQHILFFAFLLVLVFLSSVSAQKEQQLLPVDEASKDASFKSFRDKFITAVKNRDVKYVLSVVDRNIKNGFGGMDGIENFKKQWKINTPQSHLWSELLFVLTHGGSFDASAKNKTFYAPYIYSKFPENFDGFEYSAIVGENVNLRATPFTQAPAIAVLNYNIVKVDYQNSIKNKSNLEKHTWLRVETLDGKKGFVREEFVKSPIGYRAGFEKWRNGQWKMVFFLAGD